MKPEGKSVEKEKKEKWGETSNKQANIELTRYFWWLLQKQLLKESLFNRKASFH